MREWLKTNRKRLGAAVLLAAAAVLAFQFMWLDPDTHSDSISVLVMETSGLKTSESRSEVIPLMTRGMRSFWRWSTANPTAGISTRAAAACRPAGERASRS